MIRFDFYRYLRRERKLQLSAFTVHDKRIDDRLERVACRVEEPGEVSKRERSSAVDLLVERNRDVVARRVAANNRLGVAKSHRSNTINGASDCERAIVVKARRGRRHPATHTLGVQRDLILSILHLSNIPVGLSESKVRLLSSTHEHKMPFFEYLPHPHC